MNWFEAWRCGSGMLAPASNLINAIDDPPFSSRQSIFSETPASDFSRQGMSLLCSSTSSRLGMPAGTGGAMFCSLHPFSVSLLSSFPPLPPPSPLAHHLHVAPAPAAGHETSCVHPI